MFDNVSLHPDADKDIQAIFDRYDEISGKTAQNFREDLETALTKISNFPSMGHPDPTGFSRVNLKRYPYHVLYEEHRDIVRVMVVRHDKRGGTFGSDRT